MEQEQKINQQFAYHGLQHVFKKEVRCLHTRDDWLIAGSYDYTAVIFKFN